MARWPRTILLLLQGALLASFSQADVQCRCTTSECQSEGKDSCLALNICYVQYMPLTPDMRPDTPLIIRGCIDERTPILCENRRPQTYTGPWPVLYCCKDDGCNEEVIPTIPAWVDAIEGQSREEQNNNNNNNNNRNKNKNKQTSPGSDTADQPHSTEEEEEQDTYSSYEQIPDEFGSPVVDEFGNSDTSSSGSSSSSSKSREINPLYIGVPVAGACILLAIIIFAIYILRRQNQYIDEYHYQDNLKHQHQNHHHHQQQQHLCHAHQHPYIVQSNRTAYPVRVTGDGGGGKSHSPYPDSERSSSGSETKLLMKV